MIRTPTVVWIAGTNWDAVAGTDRRMVEALSASVPVLWVDPPIGWKPSRGLRNLSAVVTEVAPGVTRLTVPTLPGVTRLGIRELTSRRVASQIHKTITALKICPVATVVAFPLARFPEGIEGKRAFYVTDDWLSGATLMRLSPSYVASVISANLADADVLAAVSPLLLESLSDMGGADVDTQIILPNGCPTPNFALTPEREPVVGLVGTLNERLDLDMLEAVRDTGVAVRVIGPRFRGGRVFEGRLDRLLSSPNVEWLGEVPGDAVQAHLARLSVGMTPYIDSAFNRASFPLKTLEYLSAGVPVVSTDLPSARWLNSQHISLRSTSTTFAEAVVAALAREESKGAADERRAFAQSHSWDSRANVLMQNLGLRDPEGADEKPIPGWEILR